MFECNLSGHRVLSPCEAYHKRPLEGVDSPVVSSSKTIRTSSRICYMATMGQRQAAEVKGTVGTLTSFTLTENERASAKDLGSQYTIWLVTSVEGSPRFNIITNPEKEPAQGNLSLEPSDWEVRGFEIVDTND